MPAKYHISDNKIHSDMQEMLAKMQEQIKQQSSTNLQNLN
jgi:hypothetical protein